MLPGMMCAAAANEGFPPISVSDFEVVTILGFAGYRLGSDGNIYERKGAGSYVDTGANWGPADDAQARATVISGSGSGTFDSWVNLDTGPTWSTTGALSFTLELGFAGVAVDSATITLSAS